MDFSQTEEQKMVAETVRAFAKKYIKPKMMEWDESQEFPVDVFKKMGELGLLGVLVPTEYDGSGY
ncbi:MAG TPA: acyl-CoA dehydrogenase family protein, partial [Flavobacteriales bacterium]|nr:acyl-CoA dehydrogenase family protein [Flavobacteriales bacterium]